MANASVDGTRYIITGAKIDHKGRKRLFSIDGERIGVYEIGDCQDRPYMMRVDFSETLRRGDAYARVNNSTVKLGRRQLLTLFEKKFRDSSAQTAPTKSARRQLVIFNQGDEPVHDASLTMIMPNHDAFHVATQLPKTPKDNQYITRTPAEQADYPSVSLHLD